MKKLICLLLSVCMTILTAGCSEQKPLESYQTTFIDLFDTAATVIAFSENEESFANEAQQFHSELEKYHKLYDIYTSYEGINNIKTVNDNAGKSPVKVDREIIDLLLFGERMFEESGGKVNIAFGSVLKIWHDYRSFGMSDPESAELPPREKLEEAALHTDMADVIIDEEKSTVFLADPEMSLDVGAIAKGYAVEQSCLWAEENLWKSAAVSIGGNVRTIGRKADAEKSLWRIGIQSPDEGAPYLFTVGVEQMSIVSSGDYQRYYVVDGQKYHHIIDPETLMPAQRVRAVSIVTPDSGYADGLSTALFLMSPEEGKELLKGTGAEAVWVMHDGSIISSDGFNKYIVE